MANEHQDITDLRMVENQYKIDYIRLDTVSALVGKANSVVFLMIAEKLKGTEEEREIIREVFEHYK